MFSPKILVLLALYSSIVASRSIELVGATSQPPSHTCDSPGSGACCSTTVVKDLFDEAVFGDVKQGDMLYIYYQNGREPTPCSGEPAKLYQVPSDTAQYTLKGSKGRVAGARIVYPGSFEGSQENFLKSFPGLENEL